MSTTQPTKPLRPAADTSKPSSSTLRRPSDRIQKDTRSPYAQHVVAVEDTMREEYVDGTQRVTTTADDPGREEDNIKRGGVLLAWLLTVASIAMNYDTALGGDVTAWSYVGLALFALAVAIFVAVRRENVLKAMAASITGADVHTLTATAIEALRQAPAALREAEATDDVVEASEVLLGRGETHLVDVVASEDPTSVDLPAARALVRLSAKSLALVAINDQTPEAASKAAVEALATPQRTASAKRKRR